MSEQVQPDWVARLPEHEVRGDCEGARSPLVVAKCREKGRGARVNEKILRTWQQIHTRTTVRTLLDGQRRVKNLFQQITLIDACGRAYAQALAFLQQHDLISIFGREI